MSDALNPKPAIIKYTALRALGGVATHRLLVGVPMALCLRRLAPP